ncbi:MAG: hypothetical protein HC799_18975 [Limnothrix sp. RL_2_0]|nr:hypothetical protein [Limnothrix sp. RL_2_0]
MATIGLVDHSKQAGDRLHHQIFREWEVIHLNPHVRPNKKISAIAVLNNTKKLGVGFIPFHGGSADHWCISRQFLQSQ